MLSTHSYSLLTSLNSLPTPHTTLLTPTHYSLLTSAHYDSLLTAHCSLHIAHSYALLYYLPLITHHPLLTSHYSLLTPTHYLLLTTHYSLLITHYSLLVTTTRSPFACSSVYAFTCCGTQDTRWWREIYDGRHGHENGISAGGKAARKA